MTDIPEFIEAVFETVASSGLVEETEFDVEPPVLRVILVLKGDLSIDIFKNFETSTTSFTLVGEGGRLFGIDRDNLRGWHRHPFHDPGKHVDIEVESEKELLATFIRHVEKEIENN